MTQLSDDCFAVGAPLLSVDEALAVIAARIVPVAGSEAIPLLDADGRILAEDVIAPRAVPPHDNSAMDGYALRHEDLAPGGGTVLPIRGRIAAGRSDARPSAAGAAIRIFTGAPMPPHADTVVMQEDVEVLGDAIRVPRGLARGANRRAEGEDIPAGSLLIPAGRRLRPQDLALAAAVGLDRLRVRRRLRLALFSTGDELAEPGASLDPGMVYDSNRVMLAALFRRLGAEIRDRGFLRDDPALVSSRLAAAAAESDIVVTSGGVSTGDEDHVKAAVESVGRLDLWRLAIKPGRPVAMGMVAGVPFVGLPGNPVAAYVTCLILAAPLIARLAGARDAPALSVRIPAGFEHRKKAGRREFLRVSLRERPDGEVELAKFPREGAALVSSLAGSDGLAEIPEAATDIARGDILRFYPHIALQG